MRAPKRAAFALFSAVFAAAGAFHVAAALLPSLDPTASPSRHAVFVAINLACALGFALRPRWFVAPFALLVIQQFVSHGGQAWREWHDAGRVDVASLAVLALLPLALALLISNARRGPA